MPAKILNRNEMNVTSKFRQMYWAKNIVGFVAGVLFAEMFFHISTMENGKLNFQYLPYWFGIIITVALIIQIFYILTLETINVTEKEVTFKYLFFNNRKVIQYEDIINTKRVKVQMMVKAGPVSDGYHSTILNLTDGKQEIISPDLYENYMDIVMAIRSNMNHEA